MYSIAPGMSPFVVNTAIAKVVNTHVDGVEFQVRATGAPAEGRQRLAGRFPSAEKHLVVGDPRVGGDEVLVRLEGPPVVLDRLLEATGLHQQLGVGVVGVGIVGNQLDVAPKGGLGRLEVAQEAMRISHLVVGRRVVGVDLDRALVAGDGLLVLLAAEMEAAEGVVSPLVRRIPLQQRVQHRRVLARELYQCSKARAVGDPDQWRIDATVHGTWGCPSEAFPAVLEMIYDRRVALEPFVDHAPMSELNRLLDDMAHHRLTKRMILHP